MKSKILIVINADTSQITTAASLDRTQTRLADYTALQSAMQAEVLSWKEMATSKWATQLAKVAGRGVTLAVLAFLRRNRYELIYTDSENNGILLALLFKLSFTKRPLMMLAHRPSPFKKAIFFKYLHIHTHISQMFVHASSQYQKVTQELGVPAAKVQLMPYEVDTEFWKAEHADPTRYATGKKPFICTVGLEFRDYPTLIEAVRDLDLDLKIGAASHWSKRKNTTLEVQLPSSVDVRSYNYNELRDLYAGSSFVVVPVFEVDFQAGITVILEAMAMSKAIIVTHTSGQTDTLVGQPPQADEGNFIRLYGGDHTQELLKPFGYYVQPGDVAGMKQAIQHLLANPAEAAELGAQGRKVAETLMSVEQFAERIQKAATKILEQK
jgi:glycosyltransferase involved in cell wall biosynthesis